MALREILAKFGFDYDKAKLREVSTDVDRTKGAVSGAVKAIGGAVFLRGLQGFISGIEDAGVAIHDLEEETGATARTIQLFTFGAGKAGVGAEEWEGSMRRLSLSLGRGAEGSEAQAAAFKTLGVATKDADGKTRSINDILPELVDGFGGIADPAKRSGLAVDLFGRAGTKMVGFLSQGKEGLAALAAEFDDLGGGLTEDAIKAAADYRDGLKRLDLAASGLKGQIGLGLFPALEKVVTGVAHGIAAFREFSKNSEIVKGALVSLGVAGVIALHALLAPVLPVIAAFTALALILDDLSVFFNGGKSLFGTELDKAFGKGTQDKVREGLQAIGDDVKKFFKDLTEEPKKFAKSIQDMLNEIANPFNPTDDISKNPTDIRRQAVEHIGGKNVSEFLFGSADKGSKGFLDDPLAALSANHAAFEKANAEGAVHDPQLPSDDWFARISNKLFGGGLPNVAPAQAPLPGSPENPRPNLEQNNKITIQVVAGTSQEVVSAVETGAGRAVANERRAALASLEQTSQ